MAMYMLGTGIGEVTDRALNLPMQGMADDGQRTGGVERRLYARAFIVEDAAKRVVIVVADIWAGTRLVKDRVIQRLAQSHGRLYRDENVLFAGTHNHSGPGGYTGSLMYDFTAKGRDDVVVAYIVDGCVHAIEMAHANVAPGQILVNRGTVLDCGRNRSPLAYARNPPEERSRYGADTDTEMLLLKFVKDGTATDTQPRPVGVLTWYAIHPTDRGQKNHMVCGDNKGHASAVFERAMGTDYGAAETFVAAFANANCGDVSGSVELGHIPDGVHDQAQMVKHGEAQFEAARALYEGATDIVAGTIDYRHQRVDFSDVAINSRTGARTWPAAIGLSFAAGSSEDSDAAPDIGIQEGVTVEDSHEPELLQLFLAQLALSATFGVNLFDQHVALPVIAGHAPKPIALMPGLRKPPAVPHVLPVQLLRIGIVAIVGVPGEITTMAGRRLRSTALEAMQGIGVSHVALGTYANDYALYITTLEEYSAQHYEGASTLYGPYTLEAHQQVVHQIATAMAQGAPVPAGPAPTPWSSPPQQRYRVRNLSDSAVRLRFYNTGDVVQVLTLPNGEKNFPAGVEVAFDDREFTLLALPTVDHVLVVSDKGPVGPMSAGQLLTIHEDNSIGIGRFTPRHWPSLLRPMTVSLEAPKTIYATRDEVTLTVHASDGGPPGAAIDATVTAQFPSDARSPRVLGRSNTPIKVTFRQRSHRVIDKTTRDVTFVYEVENQLVVSAPSWETATVALTVLPVEIDVENPIPAPPTRKTMAVNPARINATATLEATLKVTAVDGAPPGAAVEGIVIIDGRQVAKTGEEFRHTFTQHIENRSGKDDKGRPRLVRVAVADNPSGVVRVNGYADAPLVFEIAAKQPPDPGNL
jgi:neutral ceramidase